LAQLLGREEKEVESLIETATFSATLIVRGDNNSVSFAHEGPRSVAYGLIPTERVAQMHAEISRFLRRAEFENDYIFSAADHALIARRLGACVDTEEDMVELLMTSLSRTALAASLTKASEFLQAAQAIIDISGGAEGWMQKNRGLYLRFLQVWTEMACVTKDFDECNAKVSLSGDQAEHQIKGCLPYLDTPWERIVVAILDVRLCTTGKFLLTPCGFFR
jgi:hypothetical protein